MTDKPKYPFRMLRRDVNNSPPCILQSLEHAAAAAATLDQARETPSTTTRQSSYKNIVENNNHDGKTHSIFIQNYRLDHYCSKTAMLKNLRMQNGACKTAFGFFKLKITSYFKVLSLAPIAWNSKPWPTLMVLELIFTVVWEGFCLLHLVAGVPTYTQSIVRCHVCII